MPLSPGVNICKPPASSTVASPVEVQAGALSSSGNITAMRVYVDNVAVGTVNNPTPSTTFQIDQFFSLASGTHHLVIVAYLSNGSALTNGENITVP